MTEEGRRVLVMLRMAPDHYRLGSAYSDSYGSAIAHGARRRMAGRIARSHGFALADDWPMPLLGVDCFVMIVPTGVSSDAAVTELADDNGVAWAQPLQLYHAQGARASGGDPLFAAQPAAAQWHLDQLHRVATGRGVSVAIIDSRIDVTHPDLAGQVGLSEDFVGSHGAAPELHGTAVAGVIAARAGNNAGIAGIAPNARLMGLRACWQQAAATVCDTLSLAKALNFAIDHRARVINLSLSGPYDILLSRLVGIGLARGETVVAAYDAAAPDGGFPASQAGVVAVASDPSASLPARVYVAPGRDIPTAVPGGRWSLVDGSSYSAAHVTGLLALMSEAGSGRARRLVRASSGTIDACASLVAATPGCSCDCAVERRIAADDGR